MPGISRRRPFRLPPHVAAASVLAFFFILPSNPAKADQISTIIVAPLRLGGNALAAAQKADSAVRANDFKEAARQYAIASAAAPDDSCLRLALGVALLALGRNDEALPQFRRASDLDGDNVVGLLLLREVLNEKGELAEASEVGRDVYLRFGRKTQQGLDASDSIRLLTAELAQTSDSPVLRLLLGDAFQLSEDWPNADSAYAEAHRRAPLWSKPLVNGGLALLAQGKTDDAIREFTEATNLDPANAQVKVWKGEAEMRAGRNDRAISTLRQVVSSREITSGLRERANTSLGMAFANSHSYTQAISALSTARELAPADPAPAAALGEVKRQAGDYHGAASAYDVALSLTRSGGLFAARPVLFRALAEAQLSDRRPDSALTTLRNAIREEPFSAPLWHRLSAQAFFDEGRRDDALSELLTSLDLDANSYPIETLNALAARQLITHVGELYRHDLESAGNTTGPDPVAMRSLSALANLARYSVHTGEEIGLRREIARRRGSAADWFQLAEVYDMRSGQPDLARDSYRHALECLSPAGTGAGDSLTESQIARARKRLEAAPVSAVKP